jgi:hypothetical protein
MGEQLHTTKSMGIGVLLACLIVRAIEEQQQQQQQQMAHMQSHA